MSVKIPKHLIEPRPRKLSKMKVGETCYFWYATLSVTATGECYLDPDASISDTGTYSSIRVERRADGYHVVVDFQEHTVESHKVLRVTSYSGCVRPRRI
jgi:hypothetical protein